MANKKKTNYRNTNNYYANLLHTHHTMLVKDSMYIIHWPISWQTKRNIFTEILFSLTPK